MFEKEAELVTADFVKSNQNYNVNPGGRGGIGSVFSEEHKLKLSVAKENYVPWNTGKQNVQIYSSERNLKISEARKKNKGKMIFIYFEYADGDVKRTKIYKNLFEEYYQQGWLRGQRIKRAASRKQHFKC